MIRESFKGPAIQYPIVASTKGDILMRPTCATVKLYGGAEKTVELTTEKRITKVICVPTACRSQLCEYPFPRGQAYHVPYVRNAQITAG